MFHFVFYKHISLIVIAAAHLQYYYFYTCNLHL